MSMLGGWEAKFSKNFPQKIATAIGKLNELFGASYNAVAYLGSQPVNGINHAVLAEQTILCGKDVKNAVILVFNEKPSVMDVSLVAVRTISESGGQLGGMDINVTLDIPAEAKEAFESAINGWVGSKITPVAFIGSQVVSGVNYEMIAEVTPVAQNATTDLALITVNGLHKSIKFKRLFELGDEQATALGYAFTWLTNGKKTSNGFGAPLGEWP